MLRAAARQDWLPQAILWLGIAITAFPLYLAFVASTLTPQEIAQAPMRLSPPVASMMFNSLLMALVITAGKIAVSIISAYAVVFFRFPGRMFFFWCIFITLMLPVEVRIMPTYEVVSDLRLINSFAGLTIPLIASATATLLFRQFFDSRRVCRGGQDRRRRSDAFLSRCGVAAVAHQHRCAVRDPVHLRLESILVAAADGH
jgi:ABC-type glycerol-3-phosphate transport system permease component